MSLPKKNKTLVIRELDPKINMAQLCDATVPLGTVISIKIKPAKEGNTTTSALVEFEEVAEAEKIAEPKKITVAGKEYELRFAKKSSKFASRNGPRKIKSNKQAIVINESKKLTDKDIIEKFECLSVSRPPGENKNFLFVTFNNPEELNAAIKNFNGKKTDSGEEMVVKPAFFTPKNRPNFNKNKKKPAEKESNTTE